MRKYIAEWARLRCRVGWWGACGWGRGRVAGHVAGSAATIALVAPSSDDAQLRDLIQFDLEYAEDLARRRYEDRSGWISSRMGRRVGSRRPTGLPPSALRPPP